MVKKKIILMVCILFLISLSFFVFADIIIDCSIDLDYIVGSDGSNNRVYTNNGSGIFTFYNGTTHDQKTFGIGIGDLNNDGYLDYIASDYLVSYNYVYLNNGSGGFGTYTYAGNIRGEGIDIGDFDGDGDLDAFIVSFSVDAVYLNNGSGGFTKNASWTSPYEYESLDVRCGDLDNDSDIDCIVGHHSANMVIYTNNGSGNFSPHQFLVDQSVQGIAITDIDDDNDLDFYAVTYGNNLVYKNNGSALFTLYQNSTFRNKSHGVRAGDLDGDGYPDIMVANIGQPNNVYINNGSGGFDWYNHTGGTGDSYELELGDVDSDGDLDCIIANHISGDDKVFLNNGSGGFGLHQTITDGGSYIYSIGIGDLDNDGWDVETNCFDGIDNDHDGWVDKWDCNCDGSYSFCGTQYNLIVGVVSPTNILLWVCALGALLFGITMMFRKNKEKIDDIKL